MTRSSTTGDWVPCIIQDHIADPCVSRSESIEELMESAKRMDERHIEKPRDVCGTCARVVLFSLVLIQNQKGGDHTGSIVKFHILGTLLDNQPIIVPRKWLCVCIVLASE